MANEYAKVLAAQKVNYFVIGRSLCSCNEFICKTGIEKVSSGGVDKWLKTKPDVPDVAIVAVSVEELACVTLALLKYGVKRILVEKPAGISTFEINNIHIAAKKINAKVFVAYNRRYYAATQKALEVINSDGGVKSFDFEFTEWSHEIEVLKNKVEVKKAWFLANSTHVVDLAFFLGGKPRRFSSYIAGSLSWHPSASAFAGAGVTEEGALFSYHANWAAPGRWGVEILTKNHRLILRPLEQLHIQKIGSVGIDRIEIDDQYDVQFKPGLYKQVEVFLSDKSSCRLATIEEHNSMVERVFSKMCSNAN
jgi:predicted dehydrogenase